MTQQFKVGEIATLQNATIRHDLSGTECAITGGYAEYRVLDRYEFGYLIETESREKLFARPQQLRRHPPKSDDAEARRAMLDCIERAKMGQGAHV